nr:7-cyano-7-deazaguanine synthase [Candidatus Njordarchaeota archaeon]
MGSGSKEGALVLDEFTERVRNSISFHTPLVLSFSGPDRNLENDLDKVESSIGGKVHPLILDLYKVALVAYVCDRYFQRGDVEPRDISIVMAVSNKQKWDGAKDHLEAMLRFLSGDSFTFDFIQGSPAKEDFEFHPVGGRTVALFSGGLDSLAGVKWLVDRNEDFILVSHPAMPLISGAQRDLVGMLSKLLGRDIEWHQIRALASPVKGIKQEEITQRLRSFLYLALASVFALTLGLERINLFENGVLALNIPLTQARVNGNTRTAHPSFIRKYTELIGALFGASLTVHNPFLQMTKAEVIKLLDNEGFRDLVKTAISCADVGRLRYKGVKLKEIRHCGVCFPCVIRRLSMHCANLWDSDAKYNEDIFGEYDDVRVHAQEGLKILLEIMDFARAIENCKNIDEVTSRFPEFYADEHVDPSSLVEMTRRHLMQAKDCIVHHASETLKEALMA